MRHYDVRGNGRTKSSTTLLLALMCLIFRAGGEEFDMESHLCGGADNVTCSESRRREFTNATMGQQDAGKSRCDAEKTCERNSIHTSDYCHGVSKYRQTANHSAACDRSFTNLTGDGEFTVESHLCGGADNVTYSESRRQEFTNTTTGQQGTMDVLRSRREAKKKFKVTSNTIQTSVPSDDIFKSQKSIRAPAGLDSRPRSGRGEAWNHSLTNLTQGRGEARNHSLTNLTRDGEFSVESPRCGGEDNVTYSKSRREEFTNTTMGQQGTMDVLKSRREAKKKFKVTSNTIQTSVPSDDIFKSQKSIPGVQQPSVGGASCDHSAANQTAVRGAAFNHSVTNLTAVHGAACGHSVMNLTRGMTSCSVCVMEYYG